MLPQCPHTRKQRFDNEEKPRENRGRFGLAQPQATGRVGPPAAARDKDPPLGSSEGAWAW